MPRTVRDAVSQLIKLRRSDLCSCLLALEFEDSLTLRPEAARHATTLRSARRYQPSARLFRNI